MVLLLVGRPCYGGDSWYVSLYARSGSLRKSLCGKYPCPHICSRVCHCPAGEERVRWLWFVRRGERGQLRRLPPQEVEMSEARAYIRQETRPKSQRAPRFYPTHKAEQGRPAVHQIGSRRMGKGLALVLLLLPLAFLLAFIFLGEPREESERSIEPGNEWHEIWWENNQTGGN